MSPSTTLPTDKILGRHRDRLAIVYVRQSTLQQLERHQESTRLQYALVGRAEQFGWARERIVVIDDDLGRSGASVEGRLGFQRLVAEVGLGHVGLVLGIEVSRLARSCRDWHQLLETYALRDCLIADADGVYNPSTYNDRLLLGLKGTLSEAELGSMKNRGRLVAPPTRTGPGDRWRLCPERSELRNREIAVRFIVANAPRDRQPPTVFHAPHLPPPPGQSAGNMVGWFWAGLPGHLRLVPTCRIRG